MLRRLVDLLHSAPILRIELGQLFDGEAARRQINVILCAETQLVSHFHQQSCNVLMTLLISDDREVLFHPIVYQVDEVLLLNLLIHQQLQHHVD